MNKDGLYSISEFAALTGVNRANLIFYDEAKIFSPIARGSNGYRYYAFQQLPILRLIRTMVDLGVPLKQISEKYAFRTPELVLDVFTEQLKTIAERQAHLEEAKQLITTLNSMVKEGSEQSDGDIVVKEMPEIRGVLGDYIRPKQWESRFQLYRDFIQQLHSRGQHRFGYPVGGVFESFQSYLHHPKLPDRLFSLDPDGEVITEAGNCMVGYNQGNYLLPSDLPERMVEQLTAQQLTADGPVLAIFILNGMSLVDPNDYLAKYHVHVTPQAAS